MAQTKKPNILIFMTDQERADVTYADHPCRTPHVERLAREGVRFGNVFTTMAHCCPSRASFFTGLYPSQHGIYNNVSGRAAIHRALNDGVVTFSERLQDAGYGLYFSGKWHISAEENPVDRGWTELAVTGGKERKAGQPLDSWREMLRSEEPRERARGELVRPGWGNKKLYGAKGELENINDYRLVQRGIRQLDELKGTQEPWCLYIGVIGPHDPFIVPEKYAKMYDPSGIELPPNYADSLTDKPGIYRRMRRVFDQLTPQEVKESIAHYWGFCSMMDDLFGMVLDALDRNGQAEDTLVLFMSDHGESLASHGIYCKGISPYDETYRVPCVIRWPQGISEPGREVTELVSMMDFAPTLVDLAGAAPLSNSKGASLVPWLQGERPEHWREAVFNQCNGVEIYYTQRFVRTERYKFVYNPTDVDELYDLANDPYEIINLADLPEMLPIKEEMYARIWREAADVDDIIFNPYITVATADFGPASGLGK
jgi:arylsulfatase A-like enzyme